MPYVVRWVPRGPDMTVNCRTMADVIELARELKSSGRGSEIHVMSDDVEIDVDALLGASRDDASAG